MLLLLFFLFSCSKDSDLLAEYILQDSDENVGIIDFVVDDKYEKSGNNSMVLDVLSNDRFVDINKVKIISTTNPSNGEVIINEDKTLTYTPSNNESEETDSSNATGEIVADTFGYTTEVVNTDQTVDTYDGTVTIVENMDNTEEENEPQDVSGTLKGFPTAYGAGSHATGGRGRQSFFVSNLNDSGSGSFREAINNADKANGGNIIFHVSGKIELLSALAIKVDNLTIAGQTAPQGGIDITGKSLIFNEANNLIVRYIRVRPKFNLNNADGISVINCKDMIFDHCSITWGGDEAFDVNFDSDNISIQRMLFGDSKTGMLLGDSNYPSNSENLSLHNSLFYNISHRFPNPNSNGRVDVINNVVYNWKYRLMAPTGDDESNKIKLNQLGNYYALGNLSNTIGKRNKIYNHNGAKYPTLHQIYSEGNYFDNDVHTDENGWEDWESPYRDAAESFFLKTQLPLLGDVITVKTAQNAYTDVTNNVGANKRIDENGKVIFEQDNIDAYFLSNVINNTPTNYTSNGNEVSYVNETYYTNYHSSINGNPINTYSQEYDIDFDGMPDIWEVMKFGNLSRDGMEDSDNDGYSDLEEYLNLIDY